MGLHAVDLVPTGVPLLTDGRFVGLSTDTKPELADDGGVLAVGVEFFEEDTGRSLHWTGSAWALSTYQQTEGQRTALLFEIRDLLRELVEG